MLMSGIYFSEPCIYVALDTSVRPQVEKFEHRHLLLTGGPDRLAEHLWFRGQFPMQHWIFVQVRSYTEF